MLPRQGLGSGIFEPICYSLLFYFLSWFFCSLLPIKKKSKSKPFFSGFLVIFFINFVIFYACLIADLVRGWEFLTFAIVFFPLAIFIDSFFLLKLRKNNNFLIWGLFFILLLFLILPLVIFVRVKLGLMPKLP